MKTKSFFIVGVGFIFIAVGSYFKNDSASFFSPVVSRTDSSIVSAKVSPVSIRTFKIEEPSVSFRDETFNVLVSNTPLLREKGLSGMNGLDKNQAMLFVFDNPEMIGFWMKDMKFSIDILFLDQSMSVISSVSNVGPDTFPEIFYPASPAKYVIEFSAGTLDRMGIKNGDNIEIRL